MLAVGLVVFREVLEAALIITIVLAATRGVKMRGPWVAGGVLAGLLGSVGVAMGVEAISSFADGMGQEVFNASVLLIAAALISWHVIWMASHGKQLAAEIRAVGHDVAIGVRHLSVLAVLVGVAVLREGAEIVLILHGMLSTGESALRVVEAGAIGFGAGAALSLLMYFGLVKLPLGRLFAFTNTLLILIAAGMAGKATTYLVQADILPSLGDTLWDTSHIIAQDSVLGETLGTLVGYAAQPSGIQLLTYLATIALVVLAARWVNAQMKKSSGAYAMKGGAAE